MSQSAYLFALLAFGVAWTSAAKAESVALTFDDLPTLSMTHSFAYAETTTVRLLDESAS